jgi:hypothetical protein
MSEKSKFLNHNQINLRKRIMAKLKKSCTFLTLWALTSLATAPLTNAAQFFVEPASGAGATTEQTQLTTELVKLAVPQNPGSELTEDSAKAQFKIKPKVTRIGEALVITLQKIEKDKVVFSTQAKAKKSDDLDRTVRELTRAVITNTQLTSALDGAPNPDDTAETFVEPVRNGWYLGFGPALLGNLNTSDVGYFFTGGVTWDVPRAKIRFGGDAILSGNAVWANAGLGASYYFQAQSISPYISGDFGFGIAKTHAEEGLTGNSTSGFEFSGGTGIQFLRTQNISLDLGLRLGFIFRSPPTGTPYFGALRLALFL